MKEKLSKFLEKDGFYLILFICVCAVAIAAVMVSKDNLNNMADESEEEGEDFIIVEDDLEEESIEIANIEKAKVEEVEEEEVVAEEEIEAEVEETVEVAKVDEEMVIVEDEDEYQEEYEEEVLPEAAEDDEMTLPVSGNLGTGYTDNNLIYSETLDKWTAHKGVDILAPEGSPVVAALSGTVQEVYEDPLWAW